MAIYIVIQFYATKIFIFYFHFNNIFQNYIIANNLVNKSSLVNQNNSLSYSNVGYSDSAKLNKNDNLTNSNNKNPYFDENTKPNPYIIKHNINQSNTEDNNKHNSLEDNNDINPIIINSKEELPNKSIPLIEDCPKEIDKQHSIHKYMQQAELNDTAYSIFKKLIIFNVNLCKVRIGSKHNGGHILLNHNLSNIQVVYSYGLSKDIMFERMFVDRFNSIIRMYDFNIDNIPYNSNFRFKKEKVGSTIGNYMSTIENNILKNKDLNKRKILKMNLEGKDYNCLLSIKDNILNEFEQLLLTIYNIDENLNDFMELLDKVNKNFYIFHIHANNLLGEFKLSNSYLPKILEISWVRKDILNENEFYYSKSSLSVLDSVSYPDKEDIKFNLPFGTDAAENKAETLESVEDKFIENNINKEEI